MSSFEDQICRALTRIAEAIERNTAATERLATTIASFVPDDEPATDQQCPHPPESRIPFGVTKGQPDWQCRDCGYRTVPTT